MVLLELSYTWMMKIFYMRIDEDDNMDHNLGGCVYNIHKMEFVMCDESDKVVGNRWQFPLS